MLLALLLSACGAQPTPNEGASIAPATPAESARGQSDTVSEPSAPAADQTEPKPVKETPFDKFQQGLDGAGYAYETVPMAAELVGAVSGVKYKLDFGNVELYQFEDGSESLASAVENSGLSLEGFGVLPCDFNGNLAALIDVTENKDAILDLFNSL